jgi:hypothetical protein
VTSAEITIHQCGTLAVALASGTHIGGRDANANAVTMPRTDPGEDADNATADRARG